MGLQSTRLSKYMALGVRWHLMKYMALGYPETIISSHPIMISFGKFSSLEKGSPYFFSDAATAFMAITAPEASSELADTTAGIFMSDGNFLYTARCRL